MRRRRVRGRVAVVLIATLLALLILSMPFAYAALLNLTYDANGNLVTGDGKYRTYNTKNQLVSIRDGNNASATVLQTYVYHPTEERIIVKKTYNSTGSTIETVTYVSDAFVRVVNASGTYNTTYVLAGGDQIAQVLPSGTKEFLLNDLEGSASITTNSTGSVIERTSYTPYGDVLSGGSSTRFDYEGREADPIVDDVDFRFRKYRPNWGLFLQPDDVIQEVYDPQSLNRYAFERNNPYIYIDSTGHFNVRLFGLGLAGTAGGLAAIVGTRGATVAIVPFHQDMVFGFSIMMIAVMSPNTDAVADEYAHNLAWTPIISSVVAAKDLAEGRKVTTNPWLGPAEMVAMDVLKQRLQQNSEIERQPVDRRLEDPAYNRMLTEYYHTQLQHYQRANLAEQTARTPNADRPNASRGGGGHYVVHDSHGGGNYPTNNSNWRPRESGTPGGRGGGSSFGSRSGNGRP